MTEKKHVVLDLRLSYNGPLSVEEFYREVEKWIEEKGMQKELKKKSEEVTSKGKRIEWIIEAWREPRHLIKQVVRLRALLDDVKEIRIKKKNHAIRMNEADALFVIDGFIETKLGHLWTLNPLYSFLRTLYDKYIWGIGMTETERYEGPVSSDCYELHKRLKAFLSLYKMKVGN